MGVPEEPADDPEFIESQREQPREQGVDDDIDAKHYDQLRKHRRQAIRPISDSSQLHTETNVQRASSSKDPNVNVATRKRALDEKDVDPGSDVIIL